MTSRRLVPVLALLALTLVACKGPAPETSSGPVDPAYREKIERWRAERVDRLQSETGWLSLIGLHWLEQGESAFGSDPSNPIVLPAGAAPPVAGHFVYDGTVVRLIADPSSGLLLNGDPVTEAVLSDDTNPEYDLLQLGRLRFYVIGREGRHAIRVKDPESATRIGFRGLDYFPIDPAYNVRARLRRYEEFRETEISTVMGTTATMLAVGVVEFDLNGKPRELEALVYDPSDVELFLIFSDQTSGGETYGAGRYLYAPFEGRDVELDFNRAYNPPCVFTPYATCPLPPRMNRLETRVEAGEKTYGHY